MNKLVPVLLFIACAGLLSAESSVFLAGLRNSCGIQSIDDSFEARLGISTDVGTIRLGGSFGYAFVQNRHADIDSNQAEVSTDFVPSLEGRAGYLIKVKATPLAFVIGSGVSVYFPSMNVSTTERLMTGLLYAVAGLEYRLAHLVLSASAEPGLFCYNPNGFSTFLDLTPGWKWGVSAGLAF
jgi:hypothetical protein